MISITHRRPTRLDTLRRRLDRWRDRRPLARATLPPRLWAAAVALVPEHGLYGTARALGVSYGALKRHLERDHDRGPSSGHRSCPRKRANTAVGVRASGRAASGRGPNPTEGCCRLPRHEQWTV